MKLTKYIFFLAVAVLGLAMTTSAQTIEVQGVGSSAQFLQFEQSAAGVPQVNCTWSIKSGTVQAIDNRSAGTKALPETGDFWVVWTPSGGSCTTINSSTMIWSDLKTDSTVGVRLFLATPRATLNLPAAEVGVAGAGLNGFADTALPAGIQSAINSGTFNAGFTDIRPEDAKFGTQRAFANCGSTVVSGQQYLGLGYQGTVTGIGVQIKSDFSASGFNVIDFALPGGRDPISGMTVPAAVTTPSGASPIVVTINTSDASGFGSAMGPSNFNRDVLALYYDGTLGHTILSSSTSPAATVLAREPLSGTYNTFEYGVPNTRSNNNSQDAGNCTGVHVNTNPLHLATKSGGLRRRVIGTGEMTKQLGLVSDSLGYAFWSFSNFATLATQSAKYVTVDGVDPIQNSYTGGSFPTLTSGVCTAPCPVTFAHITDGTYPVWSLLRVVTASPAPAGVTNLIKGAQSQLGNRPDFVSAVGIPIFHSHFLQAGVSPDNGNGGTCDASTSEKGGDVGGQIFLVSTDQTFCKDTGIKAGVTGKRQ